MSDCSGAGEHQFCYILPKNSFFFVSDNVTEFAVMLSSDGNKIFAIGQVAHFVIFSFAPVYPWQCSAFVRPAFGFDVGSRFGSVIISGAIVVFGASLTQSGGFRNIHFAAFTAQYIVGVWGGRGNILFFLSFF
jgi:hypothetical protein